MPALLLLFSFTLKLTILTLFYSICLQLKRINLFRTMLLVQSPKLLNSIPWLLFLNLSTGSRCMKESSTRSCFSHINLSKLVNLLTSALIVHSLHIVLLSLLLLSPLVALLSPFVLKLPTHLSIILLMFCGTVCHLIYVALLISSLAHLH